MASTESVVIYDMHDMHMHDVLDMYDIYARYLYGMYDLYDRMLMPPIWRLWKMEDLKARCNYAFHYKLRLVCR